MTVAASCDRKGVRRAGGGSHRHGHGSRRTEAAADRDGRPHRDGHAVMAEHGTSHASSKMRLVLGELRPFALGVDAEALRRGHLHLDVDAQRQTQHVISRP